MVQNVTEWGEGAKEYTRARNLTSSVEKVTKSLTEHFGLNLYQIRVVLDDDRPNDVYIGIDVCLYEHEEARPIIRECLEMVSARAEDLIGVRVEYLGLSRKEALGIKAIRESVEGVL